MKQCKHKYIEHRGDGFEILKVVPLIQTHEKFSDNARYEPSESKSHFTYERVSRQYSCFSGILPNLIANIILPFRATKLILAEYFHFNYAVFINHYR